MLILKAMLLAHNHKLPINVPIARTSPRAYNRCDRRPFLRFDPVLVAKSDIKQMELVRDVMSSRAHAKKAEWPYGESSFLDKSDVA